MYLNDIKTIMTKYKYPVKKEEGWSIVENKEGAQDFNKGAGEEHIYIYYKLGSGSSYIDAIAICTEKDKKAKEDQGWTIGSIDLNKGHSGDAFYLAYRKKSSTGLITKVKAGMGSNIKEASKDFVPRDIIINQDINQGWGQNFILLGYSL